MPLLSKKQLIEMIMQYTYMNDLEDEITTLFFEKIFGVSAIELNEIYNLKYERLFKKDSEGINTINTYVDFDEIKKMIKEKVEEYYDNNKK